MFLKQLFRLVPTFLLSFALAVAVWISAVTSSDPTEERLFPHAILLNIVGHDASLVLTSDIQSTVNLTLNAPRSIWDRLVTEGDLVKAILDISNLGPGRYTVPVQIQVGISPVQVISYSPQFIDLVLEKFIQKTIPIQLKQRGEIAVGYQAGNPELSIANAKVSGPESLVKQVQDVRAILDLNLARETINRSLNLEGTDANGNIVKGVSIDPSNVTVNVPINQRGGFRNVSVKIVYRGQVADGYRMTYLSVFPPMVMVFSDNPEVVLSLPGYVETTPFDLTGLKANLTAKLSLNLPPNVSVVGESNVEVQVGIDAIESSRTFYNDKIEIINLSPDLEAKISPENVDVILSGPLPILNGLKSADVRVIVDLQGVTSGNYQRELKVELNNLDLHVDSINPNTVDVKITKLPEKTTTPHPTLMITPTISITP